MLCLEEGEAETRFSCSVSAASWTFSIYLRVDVWNNVALPFFFLLDGDAIEHFRDLGFRLEWAGGSPSGLGIIATSISDSGWDGLYPSAADYIGY